MSGFADEYYLSQPGTVCERAADHGGEGVAEKVLDKLQGVKRTGTEKWIARCPVHNVKSSSLSIRVTQDGRVLLHCFGGCETGDVLAALNLKFTDLFDKPLAHYLPPVGGGFNARELLELMAHESFVAVLITEAAAETGLSTEARARLSLAAARLEKARIYAHGG